MSETRSTGGFNPIRWNCSEQGCFNKKLRPKIEMFTDCFPGKISLGDIDGMAERDGAFILLEWKADGGVLGKGQEIAFRNFSKFSRCIVIVVHGNPETMIVEGYSYFWNGKQVPFEAKTFDDLFDFIKRWVNWIDEPHRFVA